MCEILLIDKRHRDLLSEDNPGGLNVTPPPNETVVPAATGLTSATRHV